MAAGSRDTAGPCGVLCSSDQGVRAGEKRVNFFSETTLCPSVRSFVKPICSDYRIGSRSVVVASFETYPQSGRALIQTYFSDLLKRIPRITVLKADLLKRIPRF